MLSASQPAQNELGFFMPGGEGRTLLVDALDSVARDNPTQPLARWLKGVEQQLPVRMSKLYPHSTPDDLQSPVLLDFASSSVQAVATVPKLPATPAKNSPGLQVTIQ